jgi:hypothetical protein
MSKPFNIHDWQDKQKRLAEADNPAFKINPSDVPGTAAWGGRAGLTVGDSDDSVSSSDLRDEITKYIGLTFASWMSPSHPPFAQEYAKSPYIDKLVDGIMDIVDKGNLKEMNTTGGGASFNPGNSMAYATPNAFKKKRKEN